MKRIGKRLLSMLLSIIMVFGFLPPISAEADLVPGIDLGSPVLSGTQYCYSNAVVSGTGIKTILISFSESVASGDKIVLPTTPLNFTVSASSADNDYAKRINLADGVTATDIQAYIRSVGFEIVSAAQTVDITVTTENIQYDTYYNSNTQHYYQFIPLTLNTETWITSYSAAKAMSYMGRTGYLATVTSADEDNFIMSLSGDVGWLGGTRMSYDAGSDTFNTGTTTGYWYWADGPEQGNTFYNTQYVTNLDYASIDAVNVGAPNFYYFNWNRPSTGAREPNSTEAGGETCLTTLFVGTGYAGTGGYSWNDRSYNANYNTDPSSAYEPHGYVVEYGNQTTGDSGGGSTAFASASGALTEPTVIDLTAVSWTSASSYTCDIDLPATGKMVTISVNSGYFTVPSLGSGTLTFLGGTSGINYISAYTSGTQFGSAVFSFSNISAAAALLDDIVYTPSGTAAQTITATSSAVLPAGSDIYFGGHFYRYVDSGTKSIDWPSAVLAAGGTTDPYFGGRGYLATATGQTENSILLRLVDNGGGGADHWDDAWMGGLWQRNTGSVASPAIKRGTDGDEITYANLSGATAGQIVNLLPDYSLTYGSDPVCDGKTAGKYIYEHPLTVQYYWIDGPEAGQEIASNTADFAPWHSGEPNCGDFVYIGWEGAYWDDLSAYSGDTGSTFDKLDGYIVEFSGYGGGSTAGIIKEDTKTVSITEISSVAVTGIEAPSAACIPDTTASCATAGISWTSAVSWSPTVTTAFGYSTAYTAAATLTAANGYRFSAGPAATIDGASAAVTRTDDMHITVARVYTATGVQPADDPAPAPLPKAENVPVIIDGVEYKIGTATPVTDAGTGVQTTLVTVEETEFNKQLANASNSILIPVPELSGSTAQQSVLTAGMVDRAAKKEMTIEMQAGDVSYIMPAAAVPAAEVAKLLGAPAGEWDAIEVNITVSECSDALVSVVESAEEGGTWTLLMPPTEFNVTASYHGQNVDVGVFDYYVDRVVAIPDGVDPAKITTAIVVTETGEDYHVPTEVYQGVDGKWYARIHSLTNSVYALVWNAENFADTEGKWYQGAASEMASRMIVNGRSTDTFDGEANITRAEFAAMIIRALGLQENGTYPFTDVNTDAWYCGAVGKAFEYGIVLGCPDGSFAPNKNISRQDAMLMIERAADVAEYVSAGGMPVSDYTDLSAVSDYASAAMFWNLENGLIVGSNCEVRPQDKITRAESATVILRLLQKAALIDVRTLT